VKIWTLKPDERLREWMAFRTRIGQLTLAEACQETTQLWSYAPYVAHYLDTNRDSSLIPWPDPWVLLYENYYCDVAKSLGMLYTLYLSSHRPEDIELIIAQNPVTKEDFNLVQIAQGKYTLNFEFGTVVNNTQTENLKVLRRYTAQDLKIDLY
jgi:hypothetical protein